MFTLTLNNRPIPLPADFSMHITVKSPLTCFDKIPSSYAVGLTFPINDFTESIFGNPDRFEKRRTDNDQKFPGMEARMDGMLLMRGELTIYNTSTGKYEGNLVNQIGVLGESEQERSLLDFLVFKQQTAWVNSANYNPATHPFCCFELSNPYFFKDRGRVVNLTEPLVEYTIPGLPVDETNQTEILTYAFERTSHRTVNKLNTNKTVKLITTPINITFDNWKTAQLSVVSPFLFLNKIITEALREVNFFVTNNAISDSADLKNLCIYNNFDITRNLAQLIDTGKYGFRDSLVYKFYGDYDDGGEWVTEKVRYAIKQEGYRRYYPASFRTNVLLPKMKLGELIMSTQNYFNLCFDPKPNNTIEIHQRDAIITGEAFDLSKYLIDKWYPGEKKKVALRFTSEKDKKDLVFEERFNDISERVNDIKEPVETWDELIALHDPEPEEGDIRWVNESNCFYEYRELTVSEVDPGTLADFNHVEIGWEEFSIGFQDAWYEYGREEVEEIKTAWSAVYGIWPFGNLAIQKGEMNERRSAEQSFGPRLMVYQGNNKGGFRSETMSLDYDAEGIGILDKFWKFWNPFWANRLPVYAKFDLPVNMLWYLIWNICKKYRTREGEFIIDQLDFDVDLQKISDVEVKAYKVE